MEVKKATEAMGGGIPTAAQLEAINAQAKASMTAEQVYVFSLRLCDDQVDRDMERFDTAALPGLAKLFIGKTGIVDHQWSAGNQVARIFAAEVVQEDRVSYIKAWAYIRRGGTNEEVIADIEAGIKKEVSVGCAICVAVLKEPMDAYEFSFVAVPAQPNAGVLKALGGGNRTLKDLAEQFGVQSEYRALFKEAQLGREYKKQIGNDVVRLCLSLDLGVEEPDLRAITEKAGAEELLKLKEALETRLAESMPMVTQLSGSFKKEAELESGFMI